MKMKEFGPPGARLWRPFDQPMVLSTSEADGPNEPAVCVWLATEQSISQSEYKQQTEAAWGIGERENRQQFE